MKRISNILILSIIIIFTAVTMSIAQEVEQKDSATVMADETLVADTLLPAATDATGLNLDDATLAAADGAEGGLHRALKTKFIEGNALFMSLVALALVLGLAFCIERIIFLSLSDIDTRGFLGRLRQKMNEGDVNGASELCTSTNGPVAAIAQHALLHRHDEAADLERNVASFAETQVGKLEKGCSWITLFIAIAPSLGFLGTVIGMVMAFDQIQTEGDISPTIVASGMKVALITTIFGIIVAVVLQIFYNYILSRIEHLTSQMEQSAMEIMEIVKK